MSGEDNSNREIFVADDDSLICSTLVTLFSRAGFKISAFPDGAAFLAEARRHTPDCVILDVHMPGKSGIDMLKELSAQDYPAPILIMSGSGDIPLAVEAIKNGAFDFIEKPFRSVDLVKRVSDAIAANAKRQKADRLPQFKEPANEPLTRREREVLAQIMSGVANKVAAYNLGISQRTIEVHRARIMEKYGAKNAAELVLMVIGSKT